MLPAPAAASPFYRTHSVSPSGGSSVGPWYPKWVPHLQCTDLKKRRKRAYCELGNAVWLEVHLLIFFIILFLSGYLGQFSGHDRWPKYGLFAAFKKTIFLWLCWPSLRLWLSPAEVRGLLGAVASLAADRGLQVCRLSSVMHRVSCSMASCFSQTRNLCPLRWQADS